MEHKTAKYGLWGAIVAALITGGVALYIHYDGKSEEKKIIELEKKADKAKDTANLTIRNVYLPPINTSLDSIFFAEITNNSLNVAKDLRVKLDFGEASISQCEVIPGGLVNKSNTLKNSILEYSINELERNDSFYIYCFISHPIFKSLLITGSNLFSDEYLTYKRYRPDRSNEESGFITFFKVIASIVALVFIVNFAIVGLILINRRLKI
jgi:hypothetical protein